MSKVSPKLSESPVTGQEEQSRRVAQSISDLVVRKPNACIGFPTGRTPTLMYHYLVEFTKQRKIDWSKVQCLALDDYLDTDEKYSFQTYLSTNLYEPLKIPADNRHNPRFIDDYDALINQLGGLDLTLLGVGTNGHIAFNEPTTPRWSWTHCAWLAQSTRQAAKSTFGTLEQVPERGVTIGISTILASRRIILMAFGEEKRNILNQAFTNVASSNIPVSYLLLHKDVSLFTDLELYAPWRDG
ncbi:MAG: 6-phosphogluconolactonase [Cyanobacteria bacterium]|nr:6-phosphogluconolactonase [Cyanobacteriota bacterium]